MMRLVFGGGLFSEGLADADSMLAAGGGYTRDNTSTEGDFYMMILSHDGSFQPFWRAQNWAMERLIYVHVSGDLRWAMLALALGSLHSVWVLVRRQFVLLFRGPASRGRKDADTMVAAGRG
jgi:hypothetical protein